jgi:SNF2 family DNA or RNA helicase
LTAESKREKLKGREAASDKKAVELLKKMVTNDLGVWCHNKTSEAGINSPKILAIIDVLKRIPKDESVLIFSSFTACLDLLGDAIDTHIPGFVYLQLDGDVIGLERAELLASFKNNPKIRALLITYKVGSEGLNLIKANHCICIEPWWTPVTPEQAKARCHRTGQTKTVYIHDLLVVDSIEEKMLEICKEKKELEAAYLEGTTRTVKGGGLTKETLGRILGVRS